jgi:putative hydrolase of the HAD superfamily
MDGVPVPTPSSRLQAVLFDLDGTLLDDDAAVWAGAAALRAHVGGRGPLEDFIRAWEEATERHFEAYVRGETGFQEQRRARIREVVDARVDDGAADALYDVYQCAHEAAWAPHDDAGACLEALAHIPLAVVSNGQGSQQRRKLERLGFTGRFAHIVVSSEVGYRKPDAEIFLGACAALGADPEATVHVGDSYASDALGARGAGLTGVWLDRQGLRGSGHEPPIVSTLAEFSRLVSCLN